MGRISVRPGLLLVPKKGWRIKACACGAMFLLRVGDKRTACYVCEPLAPEKHPSDA